MLNLAFIPVPVCLGFLAVWSSFIPVGKLVMRTENFKYLILMQPFQHSFDLEHVMNGCFT